MNMHSKAAKERFFTLAESNSILMTPQKPYAKSQSIFKKKYPVTETSKT